MKLYTFIILAFFFFNCKDNNTKQSSQFSEVNIQIPTVVCEMCEETIKKSVFALEGVKSVDVDLVKKITHVKFNTEQTNLETIEIAISNSGYDANSRKRNPDSYASLPECCKTE